MKFSKGILKNHLPIDLAQRVCFFEDCCNTHKDEIFGKRYDLLNDQSIWVYDLPGHAAGQIGIRLLTDSGNYFLIADACWLSGAYLQNKLPHPITKLIVHSWKDYTATIKKITRFHKMHPEVKIIPSHCAETAEALKLSNKNICEI